MAAFVNEQEHFMRITSPRKPRRQITHIGRVCKGRDIDLGPLVGSMKGFPTRERVPMRMDGDGVRKAKRGRWGVLQLPYVDRFHCHFSMCPHFILSK
jgi:hypothetical protein